MKRLALAALFLAATGQGATAQEEALVTLKVMAPETALTLAKAALEDCRGKGFQVAVAVVDRFGNLQALLRDRYAGPHTPETARRKAWTAVSFRTDTLSMREFTEGGKEASGVRFVDQALMVGAASPCRLRVRSLAPSAFPAPRAARPTTPAPGLGSPRFRAISISECAVRARLGRCDGRARAATEIFDLRNICVGI